MRRTLTVSLCLVIVWLSLTGCGALLSIVKSAPPAMPVPLQPSVTIQEMERALVDWSAKVSKEVYDHGVEAKAPIVGQQGEALEAVSAVIGKPATPLPMRVDAADSPGTMLIPGRMQETDAAIVALRSELKLYREREAKWKAEYEKLRGTPVETITTIGGPTMPWKYIAGAIALFFIVPSAVWGWLLKRALGNLAAVKAAWSADRHALATTVAGLETAKSEDAAAWLAIKPHLAEAQDAADKRLIDAIRRA